MRLGAKLLVLAIEMMGGGVVVEGGGGGGGGLFMTWIVSSSLVTKITMSYIITKTNLYYAAITFINP